MRHLPLILILLLSFTGCESKEQQAAHDAKIAQEARAELLSELKVKEEARLNKESLKNEKLSRVGVSINDNTITIDTNKTKDFFRNIGNTIKDKLKIITKDLEKGIIEGNETGIDISKNHINIDLNKTKDFLDIWGKKMQSFVKDIDDLAKQMDTKN